MHEILFEKDLIRNSAQELGMSVDKVKYHLNFMRDFIEEMMSGEEVHVIQIPHVGTMYRNIKACAHMNIFMSHLKTSENKKTAEKREGIKAKNERNIKTLTEEISNFDNFSLHNYKRRMANAYFTTTLNKRQLEEFQNAE